MKTDFLKIENETHDEFKEIANMLLNKCAIQTKDSIYRITIIEFYWTSDNHKDNSTYDRRHANPKTGEWFFHYSGVDIALENSALNGHGGILIREIFEINSKKHFKGPQVCAMRLFSGIDAFSGSFSTKIIRFNFSEEKVVESERTGLGNNAMQSGSNKLKYQFRIHPK